MRRPASLATASMRSALIRRKASWEHSSDRIRTEGNGDAALFSFHRAEVRGAVAKVSDAVSRAPRLAQLLSRRRKGRAWTLYRHLSPDRAALESGSDRLSRDRR